MSCGKGQPHLHLAGRTIYTGSIEGLARNYAPRYATGGYGQNTSYALAMNPLERLALPELSSGYTERVDQAVSITTHTDEVHVHPRREYMPEPENTEKKEYAVFIKLHIGLPELPKQPRVHHLFNRPAKQDIAPYPVEEADYSVRKVKQRELKAKLAAAKLQDEISKETALREA